jgi:hypothetical protein
MPYTYVQFQFRYINEQGKHSSKLHSGTIDETSIILNDEPLHFEDIHQIKWHKNRVAFELYPYLTLSSDISDHIIQRTTSIIIEVEDEMEKDVRNLATQYLTIFQGHQRRHELEKEGKKDAYRAEQCPNCTSIVDLTNYANTHYIYCKHCEIIFDKLRQQIPQTNNYRVCPECDTYDRVQEYTEFSCYIVRNDRRFGIKEHEFCDTCAERLVDKILWKNALFLIALPSTLLLKSKATENRSEVFAELATANRFAQDGKLKAAEDLYMMMMLRNEKHPALWFNHGLAYLHAGENARALQLFIRALDYCSNYLPVLDVIRKHSNKEIYIS